MILDKRSSGPRLSRTDMTRMSAPFYEQVATCPIEWLTIAGPEKSARREMHDAYNSESNARPTSPNVRSILFVTLCRAPRKAAAYGCATPLHVYEFHNRELLEAAKVDR